MTVDGQLDAIARACRVQIIRMLTHAGSGHPGGSLSVIDLLVAIAFGRLRHDPRRPDWPDRDRIVLSKGHAVPALYAVIARAGYFPEGAAPHAAQAGQPAPGPPRSRRAARHRGRHRLAGPGTVRRLRPGPRPQAGQLAGARLLHPRRWRDAGRPDLGGRDDGAQARTAGSPLDNLTVIWTTTGASSTTSSRRAAIWSRSWPSGRPSAGP